MNDLLYLRLLVGTNTTGWLTVVYLAILFLACLFKPERIRSSMLFRWACTLLVFSIVLPVLFQAVAQSMGIQPALTRRGVPELDWTYAVATALGPVCLGLSLFCAFAAISPKPVTTRRPEPVPQKHPLD